MTYYANFALTLRGDIDIQWIIYVSTYHNNGMMLVIFVHNQTEVSNAY